MPIENIRSFSIDQVTALAKQRRDSRAIKRQSRSGLLVPSFAQQRLWFLAQMEGVSEAYHIWFGLRLKGGLDEAALVCGLDSLVERHEALRTSFYTIDGELYQRIGPADAGFALIREDWRDLPDGQSQLLERVREETGSPFDLERGPLIRGRLIRLEDKEYVLLVTMHHIVSDGWSMGVFRRELSALYNAHRLGEANPLAPLSIQYADYAAWQRQWLSGDVLAGQSSYWQGMLAGSPALLELPTDRRRPAQQDFAGDSIPLEFDEDLTAGLKGLGQRYGLTLFMTVLAGWALVLSRLSNQEDVVIGVPSANRGRLEIEGLIGFFVNTLALRIDLSGHPTVAELLERVKGVALGAQAHQDLPFEQVVDLVKPVRSLSHSPLFQVVFAWQNNEGGVLDLGGLELSGVGGGQQVAKFDLTLNLREVGGRIVGGLNYATALFDRKTIERYGEYLHKALSEMAGDSNQVAAGLPLLSPQERHKLLVEWNATETEYPSWLCVHELFEDQVARDPSATAVVYEDRSLSYGELNAQSNRLAHHLRGLGVVADSRVAICVERSLEMVVGLLAILKAGGAYVPLDPAYPADRLGYMLQDSAPAIILTHEAARSSLEQALVQTKITTKVLDLNIDSGDWAIHPATNPDPKDVDLTSKNLAYIIYTSGSTGKPKGVMVEHKGVVNVLFFMERFFGFSKHTDFTLVSPISFDPSISQLLMPLSQGAEFTILSAVSLTSPDAFWSAFQKRKDCFINMTPAHLYSLASPTFVPQVRDLVLGGEELEKNLADKIARDLPNTRLTNIYGPTETTIYASLHRVDSVRPFSTIPIGRPISNMRIYLLDGLGNPVPEGVAGELYIGGAGVARGYLNRPDLTSERFVESPFVAGDRLYKTGDLGRYLPDGNIEFLGRNDFQVKIRGFRIELGEIEARLASHPLVREAVVLAREDVAGDKRLVGYYTPIEAGAQIGAEDLRSHLSVALPEYMVPAAYVRLEALPLTPNGKLDRKALPAPDEDAYGRAVYEAPAGPVETALAEIWSEVLGVERVGRGDSFFDLGGHSLLAVRVLERMRRAGLESDVRSLFTTPVLADLAASIKAGSIVAPAIDVIERSGLLVPSFAQQRLWFLAQMEGVSEAYHIWFGLRLKGGLDEAALVCGLDSLVERHEALRTSFYTIDGELYQRIGPADAGFALIREDWRDLPDGQSQLLERVREETGSPFDLERGPLIRGRLIRLEDKEYVLLVTMHHIVSDGWSMGVFRRELSALYNAHRLGEANPLAPLSIQYADYAAWQRQWLSGDVLAGQSSYWQGMLAGSPALLELPTDRRRPAQQDFAGDSIPLEFDEDLTAGLKGLGQRYGLTLFMTVLAGWALVLSRLSNQEDVVIGVPSANRGRLEIEGLIGFFVNTLALRIDLSGHPTVAELLERVKGVALGAQAHQDLPFEQVVDLVKPVRSLSHSPLFQVVFAWQNNEGGVLDLGGLELSGVGGGQQVAKFDLTLNLREVGGRIVGGLNYATALFDRKTIERYGEYLHKALSEMAGDSNQVAAGLPLLSPQERHKLLVEWNATETEYPSWLCVHELFEDQVARDPSATAVVYEDRSLSYGELNAQSNRLAHHLRGLGVVADSRVAICVERSLEMVVGLLAILKAGGAYVPLDPAYPADRLGYMLQDSAPAIILTHEAARSSLEQALVQTKITTKVLDLNIDSGDWAIHPATNPDPKDVDLTSKNLAYIIYTSGSTGKPKGVMVEHRNVERLFTATKSWFEFDQHDVWTLFHSFAFDFSVWEIWGALLHGGKLIVIPQIIARSPHEFYELLCERGATVLNQTPSAFRALIAAQAESKKDHCLRAVVFGGEALEVATLRPWYERRKNLPTQLINMYGITETTVHVTHRPLEARDTERSVKGSPIGCRIPDLRIYLLDGLGNPVPEGVAGELYIGGAGVARGYLNRPDLTSERFVESPFVAGDRLYKTGDLGRYLPDGNIEFLGRNDFQVKIRGFRIELGEIEARLASHPLVREAVVLAREDVAGDKRLVGYYTPIEAGAQIGAEDLRSHLSVALPEYMVPAAYVRLEALPLTPNGKLDRKALPAPDEDAYGRAVYEAPAGPVETALAEIWSEVLGVERVGRGDSFFDLGGHSLLAVRVLERMRRAGLESDVRSLFTTPVLADLAAVVGKGSGLVEVPANRIEVGCKKITPDHLPLIALTQGQIDAIVEMVPGGSSNVQDIYPLAPLQEGILFHHLMAQEGDPYLLWSLMSFADRETLDRYVAALNAVIGRHDILRTAVLWEGLPEPAQVVWRHAPIAAEEILLDPADGDVAEQLKQRFNPRHYRLDVRQAPMIRLFVAHDPAQDRWVMMYLFHHIIDDASSLKMLNSEVQACLSGGLAALPPALPFRNFVAQARLGLSRQEHEAFFGQMLGDVNEPTAPFGLMDVQGDGAGIGEARLRVDADLAKRVRVRARTLRVSAATLWHVAWGLVVSRTSGQQDPVFGTVLFGRMQGGEGADRVLGLFINTLPVRLSLGQVGVRQSVRETHKLLAGLLRHEHASLALAQRCSSVPAPAPLFTALLNYRHNAVPSGKAASRSSAWDGIKALNVEERTNYPINLSIDDLGEGFSLTAQSATPVDPHRLCAMMHRAIEQLVEALELNPDQPIGRLDILPPQERHKLLVEWNATETEYPSWLCVHELFEDQVARDPSATAVVYEDRSLSYGELNAQSNRLAHHLRGLGVVADSRVAICVERSLEMVVGLLAILKAGGAYVPLDPAYPADRLGYMLQDSAPAIILTHEAARSSLEQALVQTKITTKVLDLNIDSGDWAIHPATNPDPKDVDLTSKNLAYIIYTSGSTGKPKGVMVEHRNVERLFTATKSWFEFDQHDVWTLFHSFAFDFSVWEIWGALLHGGKLIVIPQIIARSPHEFYELLCERGATVLNQTPSAFRALIAAQAESKKDHCLRAVVFGGEALEVATLRPWYERRKNLPTQLINMYGITETTVHVTHRPLEARDTERSVKGSPIGCRIPDLRIYLLDGLGNPVPEGVAGELYIGGAGVARGYLNRPDLTSERFVESPFVAGDRLYKTGDLGRYLPDGNIEFLGRNDFQVKIRGFRIELGEIEARLASHPLVREAVVLAREDVAGDKRLVGYYTPIEAGAQIGAEDLRSHLSVALPEYMVPAAYVRLEALPLTPNGKLDRKALPAPDEDAYGRAVYEAPAGPVETALAEIWSEVLGVERVGRGDSFFDLGGHSLLAVRVLERMRRAGLESDVRSLFTTPVLADLAAVVGKGSGLVEVPANRIEVGCKKITPDHLPLIALTQGQIDAIVEMVPGGSSNVQDIYPLAPLQEGILFHHLMAQEGDPYLLWSLMSFADRETLDRYVAALNAVIGRHDILRTAVLWEGLPEPAQVVWRHAPIAAEEILLDPADGDVAEQLKQRFNPRHYRLDVRQAPMIRLFVAHDPAQDRWVMMYLFHHIIDDASSLKMLNSEVQACLSGGLAALPPALPFRNFVAQARLGLSRQEHEAFFGQMLGDVNEPTAPFGLMDVQGDGAGIGEARLRVDADLAKRVRVRARTLRVSAATLWHVAWGLVVSRTSGQQDPVFGTVLFGRMQGGEGADRVLGLFINTLPVRLSLGQVGVRQSVRETHKLLAGLLRHEHASLALAQRCSSVPAPAPLFTALLNYRHNAVPSGKAASRSSAWDGIKALNVEERTNYPINLSIDDLGEGFSLTAQSATPVDPHRLCAMMHRAIEQLVEALELNPDQPIGRLDILPPQERHKLLVEWNATETEYPSWLCVHELFEDQVARDPSATAVVYEDRSLSYGELNAQSNRLAHHLRGLGVVADSRVAICVERSLEMVVGLLAILKAGGAYVPLDPAYPADRLGYMLQDSAPAIILTHEAARSSLEQALVQTKITTKVLDLNIDSGDWAIHPATNPDPKDVDLTSKNLAYIIYTSGSTGKPKGVMVEHKGVVNYLWTMIERLSLSPNDCFCSLTTISFDISVTEIFGSLAGGARVSIISPTTAKDPDIFAEKIAKQSISILQATPSAWKMLESRIDSKQPLKALIGGEALSGVLAADLATKLDHVWNMYGPTETTVWSACAPLTKYKSGSGPPPIGRPISNTRIYLLDGLGNPVPEGVAGELYIGGAGVARGYLNRPDLTSERFVESPFVAGDRLYKTGDLGRYLPDGNIEFLGRNDFQVKIRGFRIELGEIEARLASHPLVREAVVLAREDVAGDKRLVGYYTPIEAGAQIGAEDLRSHLSVALPEYMVPAAYVRLEALPLTPNGKLDRKALPAPDEDAYGRAVYEAPAGPVETALAEIWSEVLGVERVGRGDSFFDLGGHSLRALYALERMRRAGLESDVRSLFTTPVLADLAASIKAGSIVAPAIDVIERSGLLVPSFAQQRLWFLAQMEGVSEAYHDWFGLRLKGGLDEAALVCGLDSLVERHEALRTSFYTIDGELYQRIGPADAGFALIREDWRDLPDGQSQLLERVREETGSPFDLERGPLIRGRLIRLEDKEYVLLVTMHHIVSDGWSMGVFRRELSALYNAHRLGEANPLAPLSIQYADYAAWQRQWLSGDVLAGQSSYWQGMLAGSPALLELPTDRRRPAQQDFAGDSIPLEFDEDLTAGLKGLGQRYGLTLFMTVLAGWALVLSRLSNQEDVVIGVPSANRGRLEIEGLIGFFVNTLALRIDLSGHPTVAELLERVKGVALGAQAHQDLPFEQVVDLVKPVRSLSHSPLFQVVFAWQNNEGGVLDLGGLELSGVGGGQQVAKFDLTLNLREVGGRIVGGLNYATALFDRKTIERYGEYLHKALSEMAGDSNQVAAGLPLLSPQERHKLLVEWNATETEYPSWLCVHELFEDQVARDPSATAVVYEDRSLSYGELNAQSNRLAHHLRGLGVVADSRVAICVERSLEMVVGLLAILKAGGAYVPLDPAYPADRLGYMLQDSAPAIILTHEAARSSLEQALVQTKITTKVLDLNIDSGDWAIHPATNPDPKDVDLTSKNLAYIIYTSGSTGKPKGVMVEHKGVVNVLFFMERFFGFSKHTDFTLVSPISFDPSISQLLMPLSQGAEFTILSAVSLTSPDAFWSAFQKRKDCFINMTPAHLYSLASPTFVPQVRDLVLGGEELEKNLADKIARDLPNTRLTNIYGPTETTIYASLHRVDSVRPFSTIPIGRPISNMRIYLLDGLGNPVPEGVAGELYIGGAGVARGYLNRPDLTSERFVESPFVAGDRLYKTGDLGRYLPDGNIEFLGRNDFQVKIRGFRIELGEIEARLASHPLVREAVVLAREDVAGDKRLVGYYTPIEAGAQIGAEDLRSHLSVALPEYMVPAAYVRLEALPLTPNGKLDRKALPAPDEDAYGRAVYEAPAGPVETALAEIWSEVLGVERVGRGDSFFDLGGHSLLAVRVLERMRRAGLESDVRSLFTTPVLADLAAVVGKGSGLVEVPANRIEALTIRGWSSL